MAKIKKYVGFKSKQFVRNIYRDVEEVCSPAEITSLYLSRDLAAITYKWICLFSLRFNRGNDCHLTINRIITTLIIK